ncbi:hypothetical protein C8R47DRAFT_43555 [Mycena vitilis]|nr:hypothetical protein C8R47DRAFT_43555 [Mycena vitilis]
MEETQKREHFVRLPPTAPAETKELYLSIESPVQKPVCTFPSPFIPLERSRNCACTWAIRSKPEWQRKISDPSLIETWRKEALAQQVGLRIEQQLTVNMVNYVLTGLPGYAKLSDPVSGIECGPFESRRNLVFKPSHFERYIRTLASCSRRPRKCSRRLEGLGSWNKRPSPGLGSPVSLLSGIRSNSLRRLPAS